MPHNRYFTPQKLELHSTLLLNDTEFHHMTRVMRQSIGDTVELINGAGSLAIATIQSVGKEQAALLIEELVEASPPACILRLSLAYLRPSHLEFAIEKVVELGVDEIWLFHSKRAEKRELSPSQEKRLQQIVISATKQCGRLFLPKIEHKSLQECLQSDYLTIFGDIGPEAVSCQEAAKKSEWLQVMIGPEAGFTGEEVQSLREGGAVGVTLNKNVLRAETAAIAAVALLRQ